MAKTKVAIIGGGCAGVTAAFELTATPELRERFDVTLHTLGWRLGGKGASGRNPKFCQRIEEHGLHVWFGFYDHSFEVLGQAYQEMEKPPQTPFNSVHDAFRDCDNILLWHECPRGHWDPMRARLPPLPDLPGGVPWRMLLVALKVIDEQATPLILEHQELAAEAGLLEPNPLATQASAAITELQERNPEVSKLEHVQEATERSGQTWQFLQQTLAIAEARATFEGLAVPDTELEHERLAASLLGELVGPWSRFVDGLKQAIRDVGCTAKLVLMGIDFARALWRGVVHDVLPTRNWDGIDQYELTNWLLHHGMRNDTANAPWLRGFYDLVFAFENGDTTKRNLAAGAAVKSWLQIAFNSKGTVMHKMNGGMGDVVFSPFYKVLCERGVKVEFFQRVRRLGLSAGRDHVEQVVIQPQAELKSNLPAHWPFVKDLVDVWPCWPSEPEWACLENGDQLEQLLVGADITLEDESWNSGLPERTLVRGTDFDHVVLATSIESVRVLTAELQANTAKPDFKAMLDNQHTVATQACQLWFKRDLQGLGWAHGADPISAAYVEPLDTYSDMSYLLSRERWPDDVEVGSIAYFCGPLPELAGVLPGGGKQAAKTHARDLLDKLKPFFPNAFAGDTFVVAELAVPGLVYGPHPFEAQFWRANTTGSERYVQTRAGTVRFRLRPDDSGYENLFLAGDWTRTGLDGGCVEAAVISGRVAARAIAGLPTPSIQDTDPFPPVPPP